MSHRLCFDTEMDMKKGKKEREREGRRRKKIIARKSTHEIPFFLLLLFSPSSKVITSNVGGFEGMFVRLVQWQRCSCSSVGLVIVCFQGFTLSLSFPLYIFLLLLLIFLVMFQRDTTQTPGFEHSEGSK